MFYSKFYKKYYPFKSSSDVLSLGDEERTLLIKYIKDYPSRGLEVIRKAWNCGFDAEGYSNPKVFNIISRNKKLGSIFVELRQISEELIDKINKEESLTDDELVFINRVVYSNQYCPVLSWFLVPIFY